MDFVGQFLASAGADSTSRTAAFDSRQRQRVQNADPDLQRLFSNHLDSEEKSPSGLTSPVCNDFLPFTDHDQPLDFSVRAPLTVNSEVPYDLRVTRQNLTEERNRNDTPKSSKTIASEEPFSKPRFTAGIPVPFKAFAKPAAYSQTATTWSRSPNGASIVMTSNYAESVASASVTDGTKSSAKSGSELVDKVNRGLPAPILRRPFGGTNGAAPAVGSGSVTKGSSSARSVQFSINVESKDSDSSSEADKPTSSSDIISSASSVSSQWEPFVSEPSPRQTRRSTERTSLSSQGKRTFSARSSVSSNTPRSSTPRRSVGSSGKSSEQESLSIVALVEGRGYARGEVGLVALYLTSPKMVICQLSDSPLYNRTVTQLNVFCPSEIIVPVTVTESLENNRLAEIIRRNFPHAPLTAIPRKFFSEQSGSQFVKKLAMPQCESVHMIVSQKYYALAAVSALWRYVEYSQNLYYAPKSLHISYQGMEMSTFIDSQVASKLELVTSQLGPNGPSLFSTMNCCRTAPGVRLLRASILQPTRLVGVLEQRHEAVKELLEKPDLFMELRGVISRFGDVGTLLSGCIQIPKSETMRAVEQRINLVIGLKQALSLLQPVREALKDVLSPLLRAISLELSDDRFDKLLQQLTEVISDDAKVAKGSAAMRLQRCFAIKSGVNQILDVARKAYCEIVEDMSAYVTELAETHNLNLKLNSNAVRGFHIQLVTNGKNNEKFDLPSDFIQVQRGKNVISFTTDTLMLLDRRSTETLGEVNKMSSKILESLLAEIRSDISCLYSLSEAISQIDLVTSFAHLASSREKYICPVFEDKLAILDGRHPVLERNGLPFTSNSTFLSPQISGMIITGANMGGKTTYLLQVALLQVLAQVGSFIPAEFAVFKIVDQILVRFGSESINESNSSTFANEMLESAFIVQNATTDSLVLVDELCRSTWRDEGAPIAFSIIENLRKTGCFMVVATHESLITRLAEIYPDMNNYHMETEEIRANDGTLHLRQMHRLLPDVVSVTEYGLRLAGVSNLPPSVMSEAWAITGKLANLEKGAPEVFAESRIRKLKAAFVTRLLVLGRQLKDEHIGEKGSLARVRPNEAGTPRIGEISLKLLTFL